MATEPQILCGDVLSCGKSQSAAPRVTTMQAVEALRSASSLRGVSRGVRGALRSQFDEEAIDRVAAVAA